MHIQLLKHGFKVSMSNRRSQRLRGSNVKAKSTRSIGLFSRLKHVGLRLAFSSPSFSAPPNRFQWSLSLEPIQHSTRSLQTSRPTFRLRNERTQWKYATGATAKAHGWKRTNCVKVLRWVIDHGRCLKVGGGQTVASASL